MPPLLHSMPPHRGQQKCARAIVPFLAWLCGITVALSLRYGLYGNRRLVLGPNSSRMVKASSVFVKQVQVRDVSEKGVLLCGFSEEPELSLETNWAVSNHLFIDSYGRRGFSMWLNKESKIRIGWEVAYGGGSYGDMLVVLIKGEQNFQELKRYQISSYIDVSGDGSREAEYDIEEDDSYYIGVVNSNSRSIVMTLKANVSSKIYDTSRATSICSATNGLCEAKLLFPQAHYFVLATPDDDVPSRAWYVELSFEARLIAYFVIIGFGVVVIYLILRYLGVLANEGTVDEVTQTETETDPILPRKELPCTYGTAEEDPETSLCCSSEDLYDGKICVICYDERRDCFFTPCGHNATCYTCAQRIMEEENKLCPICRRLIHKTKKVA